MRAAVRRPAAGRQITRAEHWRRTDPAQFARYCSALETLHRDVFAAASAWLDVDAHIGGIGELVVVHRGREVKARLHPDAFGSPSALRQQIVTLARRLHERPAPGRRATGRKR